MSEVDQRGQLWRRTTFVIGIVVASVLLLCVVFVFANGLLDNVVVFGFPIGFYFLTQGLLIAVAAAAFWFASYQERIDRRHGASEDL